MDFSGLFSKGKYLIEEYFNLTYLWVRYNNGRIEIEQIDGTPESVDEFINELIVWVDEKGIDLVVNTDSEETTKYYKEKGFERLKGYYNWKLIRKHHGI